MSALACQAPAVEAALLSLVALVLASGYRGRFAIG